MSDTKDLPSRRDVMKAGLCAAGALVACDAPAPAPSTVAPGSPSPSSPSSPPAADAGAAAPEGSGSTGARDPDRPGTTGTSTSDGAPPQPYPPASDAAAAEASPGSGADGPAAEPAPSPKDLLAGIDTFVVLCMENRSFDHYLGARALVEGWPVDGLRAGMGNPDRDGRPVGIFRLDDFALSDPPHDWDPVHAQWNQGAMDGFVRAAAPDRARDVMGYYAREDLPVTWALADHFVTCDHWFCSALGPTWPNRFYLHGATALGQKSNAPLPRALEFRSIFAQLAAAGRTGINYFSDLPWAAGGYLRFAGNAPIERFFADARAGELPNLAIIDPGFFGSGANDDHPDHDVRLGQALIGSVYAALRASPQWKRSLLVVTYDEHGGFFDHVPPPAVADAFPDFRRLGMRVPTVVAGPTVRAGATVSTVFDHVSVIATVSRRFDLPPLNLRAEMTADLSPCLDPRLGAAPRPGPELPAAPRVSAGRLQDLDRRLRGRRPGHHTELWDLAEAGHFPDALDRRAQSLAIARRWLQAGEALGAVELSR